MRNGTKQKKDTRRGAMAKKQEKEIERWVTVNGARVPIFKDGSIGGPKALRDKVKAVVKEKSSDGKPLKDMSATDIGKEYLTATGERKKQLLKELHNRGYKRAKDGSWTKGDQVKKKSSVGPKTSEEYRKQAKKVKDPKRKSFFEATANRKEKEEVTEQAMNEWRDNFKKKMGYNPPKEYETAARKTIEENYDKGFKTYKDMPKGEEKFREQTKVQKTISDSITSAKTHKELTDKLNENGLKLDSADAYDIRNSNSLNGEKVTMYDKDGNEYRGTYNKYSDGGREIVDIKKTKDSPKKIARDNEDLKEKQIKQNKAEKETVEQAMDRLQKESRAKVDSMSAQQVMKYAKENGLRGLKTDTLAQRDDRVANHMYMQEMKKWREQKNVAENEVLKEKQIAQNKVQRDERNNQVSDRVKAYQDKFLKKRSVEEIKEIQSNIEKAGTHLGYTDSDMVAMRAIENELKERQNYKKEYKNPDAYFSAVSVAERALEQKALSKLEPLPYFSKEARQRDKDIANGKYRTRITDVSRLSLSDLRTVAQSLGKKTEGKSKAELVAIIEKIFKKG